MAKILGEFVARLMLALLLLGIATANRRHDVPYNGFSSYIDEDEQMVFGDNYPVVAVELLPGNQINATQKRFQIDPPTINDTEYTWNISLSYRTKGGNYGRVWMNKTEVIFDIPLNSSDDWVLFNHDMSERCRVNYDDILWDRITKQLRDDHTVFSDYTRMKLFDNARNLAKAGESGYDKVLDLISWASKDRGLGLWLHIYDFANFLKRKIFDTPIFSHFQRFMLNATSSLRDEMTFKPARDVFEMLIHPLIWSMSCSLGHKGCLEKTTRLFKAWIQLETRISNHGFAHIDVICIGIANSLLESEWNTVFERYKLLTKSESWRNKRERKDFIRSLSCSSNSTLLGRLLEVSFDNRPVNQTFYWPFIWTMDYMDSNPTSNYTSWKWLKLNSARIDEGFTSGTSRWHLNRLAYYLKTREQRQEVLDFFDNYPHAEPNQISIILGIINRNIRWMDKNLPSITQWFKQNVP